METMDSEGDVNKFCCKHKLSKLSFGSLCDV